MTPLPRVLFVDDEPQLLESLEDALRRTFAVSTALGGRAGLTALQNDGPFAVVVSDFQMPGMNGAEFLAKARIVAPATVRVLLTGQASVQNAIAAVNDGNVFRFLTKPCPPSDLIRAIEHALEQARLITADRDLLERKVDSMFAHVQRAERLASLGTMSGAIGHELNNILAVFSFSLGVLHEQRAAAAPPLAEDLEALDRVQRRLTNHARSLLEFGRPRERSSTGDFGRAITEALELLDAGGVMRHVRIQLALPPHPVRVRADESELGQVVLNLIKNAADATRAATRRDRRLGKVDIELTATDAEAVLVVRDNGIGIQAADVPLIFEPYFTTKPADQGTGLGLFVARQIVERANGRIAATSVVDVGTAFTTTLPLVAPAT